MWRWLQSQRVGFFVAYPFKPAKPGMMQDTEVLFRDISHRANKKRQVPGRTADKALFSLYPIL
jgi:hypothetical protein